MEKSALLLIGVLIHDVSRLLDNNECREVFEVLIFSLFFSNALQLLFNDKRHLLAEGLYLLLCHTVLVRLVDHSDDEVHENYISNNHDSEPGQPDKPLHWVDSFDFLSIRVDFNHRIVLLNSKVTK